MAGLNFTTNVDVHNKQDFQRLQQLITPKKRCLHTRRREKGN